MDVDVAGLHTVVKQMLTGRSRIRHHDLHAALKIVADAATGRVLGVHAVADGAGEVIAAAVYALKARMTVDDLASTWAPYLTMAESLRLVAGLFRDEMPTSCCA